MIDQVKMAYRYLLVIAAGAFLLMLSITVPIISTNADFSIYNTGWNGCSGLGRSVYEQGSFLPTIDLSRSSKDEIVHTSLVDLEGSVEPESTSLMMIGPSVPFTEEEADFVHRFLVLGGTVLLADDFGTGNSLLSRLNTTTRISAEPLVDLSFIKKGEFSVTNRLSDHPICEGVGSLLMNHPSTVSATRGAFSIVNSTDASWLDVDGDMERDLTEPGGPLSIMTEEVYGRGRLLVLAEPSLLINQMEDRLNNSVLRKNLVALLAANKSTVLIDESHRDLDDPFRSFGSYTRGLSSAWKAAIIVSLIIATVLISVPRPAGSMALVEKSFKGLFRKDVRPLADRGEVLAKVCERHPEWDRKVLERIMTDVEGVQ